MKVPGFVPRPPELIREALIVVGGALIAAWIIGNVPALRGYIKQQWGEAAH